jgi:hypothetical protein
MFPKKSKINKDKGVSMSTQISGCLAYVKKLFCFENFS